MTRTDLHVHSRYSNDGELAIEEIVNRSLAKGISVLSVTDHNIVGGTTEALKLCRNSNINFIPGIEIDCQYKGTDMHLLGYQIDWKNGEILALETIAEKKMMDAVPLMIQSLALAGIEIDGDELMEKAGQMLPSPELFAEVLLTNKDYHTNILLLPYLEGGERSDMPYINFYLDYFAQGKPAYVKIDHMRFNEAVEIIKNSGGIPVVAHPGLNFKGEEKVVAELLKEGAAGLEVFNNYHSSDQMEYFASLCRKSGSLMTGGSDFHGKIKPLINIGVYPILDSFQNDLNHSIEMIVS
ncbi:MAG: phosphatase [Bacteroidetes bacterium]|nr:MAG: phosphatase [Bacteroidota bacterium]